MFDLKNKLKTFKENNLYRVHKILDKSCVNFSSNDYLGLAAQNGIGSGASVAMSGYTDTQAQLEKKFAEFFKRDRAIYFSSGYLANLAVISTLLDSKDAVFSDKFIHASIIDGIKLSGTKHYRYKHCDVKNLEEKLKKVNISQKKLIITESIFSMTGDRAPIKDLIHLANQYQAVLVVDDAHGLGEFNFSQKEVPVLISPLGKSFGAMGAMVSGSEDFIEYLIQFARPYRYTTAMPEIILKTVLQSLEIIKSEKSRTLKLNQNIQYFKQQAQLVNLPLLESDTAIQSVMIFDEARAVEISEKLLKNGFFVTAIRTPTVPKNQARLRVSLSCLHEQEQILNLIQTIEKLL